MIDAGNLFGIVRPRRDGAVPEALVTETFSVSFFIRFVFPMSSDPFQPAGTSSARRDGGAAMPARIVKCADDTLRILR